MLQKLVCFRGSAASRARAYAGTTSLIPTCERILLSSSSSSSPSITFVHVIPTRHFSSNNNNPSSSPPPTPPPTPSSSSSSVSDAEVSKFAALSDKWWDASENPLIAMNAIRVEYIKKQVMLSSLSSPSSSPSSSGNTPFKGLRALDVGCGGGLLSESLARLGATVTAIDPSIDLIQEAKRHAQLDRKTRTIDYRGGWTIEQLANEVVDEQKFDLLCMLEVIEHVPDVESMIEAVPKLMKPNGIFFLSTMNKTAMSMAIAILGAEYVMNYLPIGTHDWNQFRSPEVVKDMVQESAGLVEVDVQGMVLSSPPVWGQWDWQLDPNNTDINWIGTYKLRSNETKNRPI